jgi:hypothetical protein
VNAHNTGKFFSGCTTGGLLNSARLHGVGFLVITDIMPALHGTAHSNRPVMCVSEGEIYIFVL